MHAMRQVWSQSYCSHFIFFIRSTLPSLFYPSLLYHSVLYPALPWSTLLYPTLSYLASIYLNLLYPTIPYISLPVLSWSRLPFSTLLCPTYSTISFCAFSYPTMPCSTAVALPYSMLPCLQCLTLFKQFLISTTVLHSFVLSIRSAVHRVQRKLDRDRLRNKWWHSSGHSSTSRNDLWPGSSALPDLHGPLLPRQQGHDLWETSRRWFVLVSDPLCLYDRDLIFM